jgi:hypothetical protein
MSFQIEGTPFTPDYKAKEKRLYQIIASRDDEIAALKLDLEERGREIVKRGLEYDEMRDELRSLKSKEYRRTKRRKKGVNDKD